MAQRIPSGPKVEPEAEPSALGRATAIPGRYPISVAEATEWATLRSDYQQLVFGNLPNETLFTIKKLNKGKKPRSAFGYATANLSNRKRCGWVDLQSLNLEDGEPAASPRTCGYSVFRVNRFAALVNCDKCGDGSFVPFRSGTDAAGKPMPAQIPLYRNLTPFGPNERGRDREPTRTLDTTRPDPDNPSQTVPNEVRFRYITRSGRWLLIKNRAFGNNQVPRRRQSPGVRGAAGHGALVGRFLEDPAEVPASVLGWTIREIGVDTDTSLGGVWLGEARRQHLARDVCHGYRGELRQRYRHGQEEQLGALGLIVNDIDVVRLSPLGSDHLTLTGRCRIALAEALRARSAYRELNARPAVAA